MLHVTQITDPIAFHGEGPCWSPAWGGLRWVDMLAGDVLSLDADGAVTRRHVGEVAAMLRPRSAGGAIVARKHDFAILHDDGTVEPVARALDDPEVRLNEGGCDPQGRLYCGSTRYDYATGGASVYRLDADHSVSVVLTGVTISNGLEFGPGGDFAYYVDTPTNRIDRLEYDPDTGFGERSTFAAIAPGGGSPDGIAVDVEGGVWVGLWGGSAVHRYGPDGRLDEVIELPASNVSACAFGGPDMTELFITTSRLGLPDDAEPEAGALFSVRTPVAGRSTGSYAG